MPGGIRPRGCWWLLPALFAVGCSSSRQPPTMADLHAQAIAARDEARQARHDRQPQVARQAADRAVAAEEAAGQVEPAPPLAIELRPEIKAARAAADKYASLAEEDQRLADLTSSWSAGIYRSGRGLAMSGVLQGLALAARQASRSDISTLPAGVRDSAQQAADLAEWATGRSKLPGGKTDWAGVADDLDSLYKEQPAAIALFLAVAHLMTGHEQLALCEVAQVDPQNLRTDEQRHQAALVRGVAYSANGLRHLAVETLEQAAVPGNADSQSAPELLASVHLLLGYLWFRAGDYRQADMEIARSLQVWPNNPLAIFLTGERLAASGEYERAADSLSALAAGSQHEWLASRVEQRAREIRDSREQAEPILHDPAFLRDLSLHFLGLAAEHAQDNAAQSWKNLAEAARSFGREMIGNLPGSDQPQE
ncbi:MAG: hypothetical protein AB7O62_25240 [Pirellulales bacterium]